MVCSLSENIRSLRLQSGLNQIQLAQKLNVTKQCVSNWENDNILPSVEMLVKIADFFKVSTDSLLGRGNGNIMDAEGLTPEQNAHIRLLISDFCRCNGEL